MRLQWLFLCSTKNLLHTQHDMFCFLKRFLFEGAEAVFEIWHIGYNNKYFRIYDTSAACGLYCVFESVDKTMKGDEIVNFKHSVNRFKPQNWLSDLNISVHHKFRYISRVFEQCMACLSQIQSEHLSCIPASPRYPVWKNILGTSQPVSELYS